MARKITLKQKAFVGEYLKTGNKTQSALKTYNTTDYKTASNIGSENLEKPRVLEFMASIANDVADHVYKLAKKAKSEQVQYNASKDILDRSGYKPTDKHLIEGNFTLEQLFKKTKDNEAVST